MRLRGWKGFSMDVSTHSETTHQWTLSMGETLAILAFALLLVMAWSKQLNKGWITVIFLILLVAYFLMDSGITGMRDIEDVDKKYKQELIVSEVIKQELLFIDKEFKELDYNQKVREYNQVHEPKIEEKKFRTKESMVCQALDPEFYEKNYKIDKNQKGGR